MFAIFDTWVLENIHRKWGWHLFSYHQRLRWLRSVGPGEQLKWLKRAVNNRIQVWTGKVKVSKPWAEAYWPQNFTPARFQAPIVLFKRPKQPYYYINDPHLGWAARTTRGVEVHEVDAKHHEILREPHLHSITRVLLSHLHPESRSVEVASEREPVVAPVPSTTF